MDWIAVVALPAIGAVGGFAVGRTMPTGAGSASPAPTASAAVARINAETKALKERLVCPGDQPFDCPIDFKEPGSELIVAKEIDEATAHDAARDVVRFCTRTGTAPPEWTWGREITVRGELKTVDGKAYGSSALLFVEIMFCNPSSGFQRGFSSFWIDTKKRTITPYRLDDAVTCDMAEYKAHRLGDQ